MFQHFVITDDVILHFKNSMCKFGKIIALQSDMCIHVRTEHSIFTCIYLVIFYIIIADSDVEGRTEKMCVSV